MIAPIEPRPKQETPAEMVEELMQMIRGQFYQDLPPKKWFSDRAFMKKNVVLVAGHLAERARVHRFPGYLPANVHRQD